MTDVSRWQEDLEDHDTFLEPSRLTTNLYKCYVQIFKALIGHMQQDSSHAYFRRLQHQMYRFRLWGSNFDAQEGGLDDKIAGAERLKSSLLPLLTSMGKALMGLVSGLHQEKEFVDLCVRYQLLGVQVSEVMNKNTSAEGANSQGLYGSITIDQLSSSESDISSVSDQSEIDELLKDLDTYNTCLFGLGSILEHSAEDVTRDLGKSREQPEMRQELLKTTAWPWIPSVIDAYPSVDRNFARRLGEANEERYNRLQKSRQAAAAQEFSDPYVSSDDEESTEFRDFQGPSGASIGNPTSGSTVPSTKLSSAFDSHTISEQNPIRRRQASPASITTFASGSGGQDTSGHRRRSPKMPDDGPWGEPYKCTVCGDMLSSIWSPSEWAYVQPIQVLGLLSDLS